MNGEWRSGGGWGARLQQRSSIQILRFGHQAEGWCALLDLLGADVGAAELIASAEDAARVVLEALLEAAGADVVVAHLQQGGREPRRSG